MKSKFISIVREYRLEWAIATVFLYLVAIPITFIVFPDNNLWLALLVLFGGFTASVTTLGDMLVNSEENPEDY